MGVKGLQFYMEVACDDVCLPVDIRRMANEHVKTLRNRSDKPTIVVDGINIVNKLCKGHLDWAYGGQWTEFLSLLKSFISQFEKAGIKLVFFFDGPVCPEKRKAWVERKMRKAKVIENLIEEMKQTGRQPERGYKGPANMGTFTRFILKSCFKDIEVYSTIREADAEIAEYAKNDYRVFAILAQDTDFVIFNTKPYLSTDHLNLDTLTTITYDRNRLASGVSLTISQLPLFSCLLGNDVILVNFIKPFQTRLCKNAGFRGTGHDILAPLVGRLIARKGWTGNYRNRSELSQVVREVNNRNYHVIDLDLLQNGISFYSLESKEYNAQEDDIVSQSHVNCENFPSVYSLLCNLEYDGKEVLEDHDLPSVNLAFRPIRQRTYDIVFQGGEGYVTEWCSIPGRDLNEPELVRPQSVGIQNLPTIDELWNHRTDIRMRYFFACLGGSLGQRHVADIQPKYRIFCCILNYLTGLRHYRNGLVLESWEVDAFIAQAIHPKDLDWLKTLEAPRVDIRAVHLTSLLARGISTLGTVLGICGNPIPLEDLMPWKFFDGKLFHVMYLRAKKGANPKELCLHDETLLKEFHKLKQVIQVGVA